MNKISGIYKITSPSGKVYIGQGRDIHYRLNRYKNIEYCKGQKHLYYSFLKYGFENHKFEILQQAPIEDLNELEINYIWRYNSTNREVGLNLSKGGKVGGHSEESKILIRANHPRCKKVYTIINREKRLFQSVGDAARQMNTTRKSIKQSIKSKSPISNLTWNFVN
jgi:hypothetical protein